MCEAVRGAIGTSLSLINWNIGGAKYLQLRSQEDIDKNPDSKRDPLEGSREQFRERLNEAINGLITAHGYPHVLTLQEITVYDPNGDSQNAKSVIDQPERYEIFPTILLDSRVHAHQGKWDKVRQLGNWRREAFFGQGNAILVRKDILHQMFPVWSLPTPGTSYDDWLAVVSPVPPEVDQASRSLVADILIEQGLYFGDRNTEPRAASIVHFSVEGHRRKALDVFVVNTHFTTLTMEREGIPAIDKQGSAIRIRQLDSILDGIISRYNRWRKEGYLIRGRKVERTDMETEDRSSPIWIIAGDFNFTRESEEYRYVIGQNFVDLIKDHGRGTKAAGLGQTPTLTVDYVFAGPLFESIDPHALHPSLARNSVLFNEMVRVSDHFPVIVTVPLDTLG